MVSLCSNTYYCWGSKNKFSSKGTQNKNIEILNKRTYKSCLNNSKTISCQNSGFRFISKDKQHTMIIYEQDKIGLSPVYVKGIVMNDGNHIHPLLI
jgi:hypothetical protein